MSRHDLLERLAAAHGVATRYVDTRRRTVEVPADAVVAVLAAVGVDASTPAAARAALRAVTDPSSGRQRRMLPPTTVVRSGDRVASGVRARPGTDLRVETAEGQVVRLRAADGQTGNAAHGPRIAPEVPIGYHRLVADDGDRREEALLVVSPDRLGAPSLDGGRTWGLQVQLYSVRSGASWGVGDVRDLAELARWSGEAAGAGMIVVNPLHAAEPIPPLEPSPYLPSSRRFRNPLYIRVEDIEEYATLPPADRTAVDELAAAQRRRNHSGDLLDRDACWAAKLQALERVFRMPRRPARQAAFQEFRTGQGPALRDFATWCALAERHGSRWRHWPVALRRPDAPGVARVRADLADRVEFHCWLQWIVDEQLAGAQRAAREAGMPLGVIHDLAVGVNPDGADAWLYQDTLAAGATVGAPPDEFNQLGQDWGQPPWRPDRLAAAAYGPYRDMIRYAFRHAGGVRIDHVPGLFRQWWVPDGAPASRGTYVRYDHEATLGILATEAHLAGAAVIGEDLGTVEPWVRERLGERGVFGTSMLWFEREADGSPRPPHRWRSRCLATVATHDLPPVAAYLTGEHVDLRDRLGLLGRPAADERADASRQLSQWLALLAERDLVGADPDEDEITVALHAFLARTPARLVGVSLADAVGERRPQNLPGTVEEYPNWRVPLADGHGRPVLVEELRGAGRVRRIVHAVNAHLAGRPRPGASR